MFGKQLLGCIQYLLLGLGVVQDRMLNGRLIKTSVLCLAFRAIAASALPNHFIQDNFLASAAFPPLTPINQ